MPGTRPPYPPEFREQIIDLMRAGHTPEELSREDESSEQTSSGRPCSRNTRRRLVIR